MYSFTSIFRGRESQDMKRVVYFCPNVTAPTGGVKIIHRHSELINQIGGSSAVYYHVGLVDNKIDWFSHNASIKTDNVFIPEIDFVILPESMIFNFWRELKSLNIGYGIFIQNGYLVRNGIPEEEIDTCYESAALLFCISDDVVNCIYQFFPQHFHKVVRVTYSIDTNVFRIGKKEKIITYMPRKMKEHSNLLIPTLSNRLPEGWKIVPIENMSEAQVADTMSKSQIFLAFSDFEGLPIPPVEAALSGNFVIGYTGQGGKQYWNRPIFTAIEAGDIAGFLDATLQKVHGVEKDNIIITENHLSFLKELFSKDMEIKMLRKMLQRIYEYCR